LPQAISVNFHTWSMKPDLTADGTLTPRRRYLILAALVLATTLYATTILVVSVILPDMQGALSAAPDQIAWVMTFNIVATAVATPMTGWLNSHLRSPQCNARLHDGIHARDHDVRSGLFARSAAVVPDHSGIGRGAPGAAGAGGDP
jgi:MFS family permease